MAARRERERRRPTTERRYRFGSTDADIAPEERILEEELEEEADGAAAPAPAIARRGAARDATTGRVQGRPFSAYASEYAYVLGDLRRVVLVVGSLLAVLIVLYFVLPH